MQFWELRLHEKAEKQIKKLPTAIQKRIINFFKERILSSADPLTFAKPLTGDMSGFWRFRIGEYRVITIIDQGKMVILALEIGHRKDVYKKK